MSCNSGLPPVVVVATGGSISGSSSLKSTSPNHMVVSRCAFRFGTILRMRRSSSHPMNSLWFGTWSGCSGSAGVAAGAAGVRCSSPPSAMVAAAGPFRTDQRCVAAAGPCRSGQ
eukprot:12447818-Heterocapsa_arctica.AAC.1